MTGRRSQYRFIFRNKRPSGDRGSPDDEDFDAVLCQFGVMFFPDSAAYREARRAEFVRYNTSETGGAGAMDLRYTAEELAFRDELRVFFRDNLPADIRERMRLGHAPSREDMVRWQRILNRRGWAAYSWPKEYGGPGWTPVQRMIFLEENQLAPAPEVSSFNITMIGPVLIQFGTEEQKKRFLPRAANIDDW